MRSIQFAMLSIIMICGLHVWSVIMLGPSPEWHSDIISERSSPEDVALYSQAIQLYQAMSDNNQNGTSFGHSYLRDTDGKIASYMEPHKWPELVMFKMAGSNYGNVLFDVQYIEKDKIKKGVLAVPMTDVQDAKKAMKKITKNVEAAIPLTSFVSPSASKQMIHWIKTKNKEREKQSYWRVTNQIKFIVDDPEYREDFISEWKNYPSFEKHNEDMLILDHEDKLVSFTGRKGPNIINITPFEVAVDLATSNADFMKMKVKGVDDKGNIVSYEGIYASEMFPSIYDALGKMEKQVMEKYKEKHQKKIEQKALEAIGKIH